MNFLKYALIILFVLSTIITMVIHPEMHQPLIIEDANFRLTRISDTIQSIPVTSTISTQENKTVNIDQPQNYEKQIDINVQQSQSVTREVRTENQQPIQAVKQVVQENPNMSQLELLQRIIENAEKQETKIQQPEPQKQEVQKPEPKKNEVQKPVENILDMPIEKVVEKIVEQPKPQPSTNKNPYMTEQEEIIAWNIWRSNIQNQIMKDSNIDYAPLGTIFTFTFVVDKFGNVSNIKVECSNPNFMNIARNNVKPAIAKLQRQPILNFPRGTQRTSTVVTGLFLIGTQERYSTPNDFSDFERITR